MPPWQNLIYEVNIPHYKYHLSSVVQLERALFFDRSKNQLTTQPFFSRFSTENM